MFRRIVAAASLLAISLMGMTSDKAYTNWTVTNLNHVNYRWQADNLNPPACTVQLDPGVDAKALRIEISYRNRFGSPWVLSIVVPPGHTPGNPAERKIVGCVAVTRVEAQPSQAAAIIARR